MSISDTNHIYFIDMLRIDLIVMVYHQFMIIMNLDQRIGSNLARLRATAQLSLDDAAYAMRKRGYKWTKMTVHNIEHGERQIRGAEIYDYLDSLGFPPETTVQELYRSDAEVATKRALENAKTALYDFMTQWNVLCDAICDCQKLLDSQAIEIEMDASAISNRKKSLRNLSKQAEYFLSSVEVEHLQPVEDIDSYIQTEPEEPPVLYDEDDHPEEPTPQDFVEENE